MNTASDSPQAPLPLSWPDSIPEAGRRAFQTYLRTVERNPFLLNQPHPKQAEFLLETDTLEVLYGGAAGGGKSDALLMAALQFVETPGYHALLLRRTFRDLNQPDALIPRSKEWLSGKAHWNGIDKRWTFPADSTLTFGYLDHADDVYQYQGAAYQFIGFDELTQFTEEQYRYLFSRLRRRKAAAGVPLRFRAASNPGGVGHEWVKKRFVTGSDPDRVFIRATLSDNPTLDSDEYIRSLSQLDPIRRAQLLAGDWDAYAGGRFRREWFRRYREDGGKYYLQGKIQGTPLVNTWRYTIVDPATTAEETTRKGSDADYTAIGTFAVTADRDLLVIDMVRRRLGLDEIVPELARVCERWKPQYAGIESIGFQAAIAMQARKHSSIPAVRAIPPVMAGQRVAGQRGKLTRATPAIVRCEAGQLYFPVAADWLEDFEAELVQFTGDEKLDPHDDQVDVLAYAVQELDRGGFGGIMTLERERKPIEPTMESAADRRGLFGR